MASDLFHDVSRAYYGVGPEVYTLANIATNGAAPEDYATGCVAEASKYAGISDTEQLSANTGEEIDTEDRPHEFPDRTDWLHEGLKPKEIQDAIGHDIANKEDPGVKPWGTFKALNQPARSELSGDVYQQWGDASQEAHRSSNRAKQLHGVVSDPKSAWDAFQAHSNAERAHHRAALLHALFGGREYASDHWKAAKLHGLHADRMSQKALGSEPYALGDARTTGTGQQWNPNGGDDNPDNWPVNPLDATAEQVESERELLRRSADEPDEEASPSSGKYVKPELPPIEKQPKSMRGQKMLFSGNAGQRQKGKPIDYAMTGTGTRVDCSKNSLSPGDTTPTPSKKEPTCSKADRDAKFNEMLKTVDPKKAAAKKARLARQEAKATAKK